MAVTKHKLPLVNLKRNKLWEKIADVFINKYLRGDS